MVYDSRIAQAIAIRKNKRKFRLFCFISFGLFLGFVLCVGLMLGLRSSPLAPILGLDESWSEKDLVLSKQRGDIIIRAIESYRDQEGMLPISLGALKPDYIEQIDPPTVGDKVWDFGSMRSDKTMFYLGVDSKYAGNAFYFGPEFYSYNSIDQSWNLFQDDF
ncbi:MAG: hypothetical protein Q9O74_08860 [Planctomycetota bacterium]|nr:hypothetical protein [Planctomycetota bacterium]